MWYLSLSFWHTSRTVIILVASLLLPVALFLVHSWVVRHCICVPHRLHPSICWWTFRLLPCLGSCELCHEHTGACVFWGGFGFLPFLGPLPWNMEVPRLGVKSELELLAYTTATAMQDPSCVCDLYHSSWQRRTLNPLSEARDWTCILMVTSRIHFPCTTMGTPKFHLFLFAFWFD